MKINNEGITEVTLWELLAIYIYDPDLMRLMAFGSWVYWLRFQGVKVNG